MNPRTKRLVTAFAVKIMAVSDAESSAINTIISQICTLASRQTQKAPPQTSTDRTRRVKLLATTDLQADK